MLKLQSYHLIWWQKCRNKIFLLIIWNICCWKCPNSNRYRLFKMSWTLSNSFCWYQFELTTGFPCYSRAYIRVKLRSAGTATFFRRPFFRQQHFRCPYFRQEHRHTIFPIWTYFRHSEGGGAGVQGGGCPLIKPQGDTQLGLGSSCSLFNSLGLVR